ncbi:site-specific DNA recombinase [Sporomusaceae bacterium BoRhaA]|uniref:recombinase family protein n=1 Tax=Pelorhabdus rhamnosifermentans TaxID=2772457 RepID=UPI001C060120|nr:recombinase family protein [Pelorhabdus rhamnosifermentans]MBU2701091.1 site-specific DNA recombinase [Pelorhabdus rhamnosifermentans]
MNNMCALYLRVSTDNQADHGVSLPAQKSRLMAYIKAQGWDLFKVYMDDGYSGKDLDRPAMKQLLKDAKQNKFGHVAVIKLDRLSRSQKDALYLIEDIFNARDIAFHSISESFDTSTPFGKASLGMLSVFAQLEREMIVDRILVAKKECAKQGRYLGGFIPYGYLYNDSLKKYVIEPIAAHTVRSMFDMYLTGQYSFGAVAEKLTEQKIPTPRDGKYWDKTTIKQMLRNPAYIGKLRHRGQIYDGRHDPIISEEQFATVNEMIKNRYVQPRAKEDDNLLTGFIYCGECGARMRYKNHNWNTSKKKYNQQYYICYTQYGYKHMSTADSCDCGFKKVLKVNQAVIEYLFSLAENPVEIENKIKEINSEIDDPQDDNEMLREELASINKKIDRWYVAYENGDIDSEQLSGRIHKLRNRQAELETQISIVEEAKSIKKQRIISAQAIKEQLPELSKSWSIITPAERRALLSRIIRKVKVYKDNNIEIELRF